MVGLNMLALASALKLISFFVVVNDVNDYLKIIKQNKVTYENRRQYFTPDRISDDVAK